MTLAAELRLGENVRTAACTGTDPNNPPPAFCTYPDRLFFMGGFDSMRGWLRDTFMPQELRGHHHRQEPEPLPELEHELLSSRFAAAT